MKISVLLDNYNYGRYIGTAIESVLGQSHRAFELIIVDDGSTDNSREIIANYHDPRIISVLKENGGQASAFNAGFARASGDYVAFLDSDDVWDPNKLERCAKMLQANPDAVLLNHNYRGIDAQGHALGEPTKFWLTGNYDLKADLFKLETKLPLVPTSFFVGRRKECLELRLDEKIWKIAADKPVVTGLGLRGLIFNFDEVLGSYRCHGANDSNGRFNDELLFYHHRRFYEAANAELRRLGYRKQLDFTASDFAINYNIVRSSKYLPKGIYYRILKRLRNGVRKETRTVEASNGTTPGLERSEGHD